jgi:uncharacterized protein
VDDPPRRSVRAALLLVAVLAGLAGFNVARSLVIPGGAQLAANVLVAVAALVIGRAAGLMPSELGLAPERLGDGIRWGGVAALAIAAGLVTAALVPPTAGLFDDDRVTVTFGEMLLRVLVVIPLGTVLVEETVFRGVLHGLLRRRHGAVTAAIWGSVAFGLWHVFPAWRAADEASDLARAAAGAGTFVATFAAGLGFVWLRHRSGHIVAPVMAHVATNSVTFAVAWSVA